MSFFFFLIHVLLIEAPKSQLWRCTFVSVLFCHPEMLAMIWGFSKTGLQVHVSSNSSEKLILNNKVVL